MPKLRRAPVARRPAEFRLIAHALGSLNGVDYLNCREGFEQSYRMGYRCFEADLLFTSDGELVCLHDGLEKASGLPVPFTLAQFRACKVKSQPVTPLTLDDLLELMREKPDWYLVTDVKDDNRRALNHILLRAESRGVSVADRIIPQIYGAMDEPLVQVLPYDRWILTMYRMGNDLKTAERLVAGNPQICAITMPLRMFVPKDYRGRVGREGVGSHFVSGAETRFQAMGVPVFVHTVNRSADASLFLSRGIGLYTDSYFSTDTTRPAEGSSSQ